MLQSHYTLGQLAELMAVDCVGDPQTVITGLATLSSASAGQLSFLASGHYLSALKMTSASAVIVSADQVQESPCHCLVSENPYLTYAKVSHLFDDSGQCYGDIHPSAVLSDSAVISSGVTIGPNCHIGDNVSIGKNTLIGAGCSIGNNSVIGAGCILYANVSVYHRVSMGDQVIVHSSAVIGSDGFGFAPSREEGWVKIAQLGGVKIGDRVEIGAATTIDRGALDDTVIGNNVIIDNHVLIAHNVSIGDQTAIAGAAGIAGSSRVGERCTIAGGAGIIGHLTIADDVHITVRTIVSKSITKAGSYSSGTMMQETAQWRKNAVRFSKLDTIYRRLTELEKKLK
ncbi:MAG: UDP-3-O-(3-hydroxymyristoyl)glucosamine N-acyltransferase [Spongiibacteraceae bacterium]|nr:UDP-3-O-(3-hydroxymyristoyl)glucosamine N-acyltransferase [Spongiibacteraceae bacterium]